MLMTSLGGHCLETLVDAFAAAETSPTMEEGTLAKWRVMAGDAIKPGDEKELSRRSPSTLF